MRLDVVSIGRKERNLQLSRRELEKFYARSVGGITHGQMPMESVYEIIMQNTYETDPTLWTESVARATYEHCKILLCDHNEKRTAIDFAAHVTANLIVKNQIELNQGSSTEERAARYLLTLSEWVQHDTNASSPSKHMKKLVSSLPHLSNGSGGGGDADTHHGMMSYSDTVVGRLLLESTNQCPQLAKAWLKLGGWFYRWGRKIVEQKTGAHGNKLSTFDVVSIQSIVPTISEEEVTLIGDIFHEHQATAEEEDISTTNDSNTTEIIEQQLRHVKSLMSASKETIEAIIEIWKQAHKATYRFYEKSAESYFKFLQVACSSPMNEEKIECKYQTIKSNINQVFVNPKLNPKQIQLQTINQT